MSRNRCRTVCECGLDFSVWHGIALRPSSELFDGTEYLRRIEWLNCPYAVHGYHDGTLFGKVVCPLCRTEYLGWFAPPRGSSEGPYWRIYDTSYWSSFNDEPGKEDKRNWRDPVKALKALDEMLEQRR
jgi:hypothetical protein